MYPLPVRNDPASVRKENLRRCRALLLSSFPMDGSMAISLERVVDELSRRLGVSVVTTKDYLRSCRDIIDVDEARVVTRKPGSENATPEAI